MSSPLIHRDHRLACVLLLGSAACTGSEHGNPEQMVPPDSGGDAGFGNPPSDSMPGGQCHHELWPRPGATRVLHRCAVTGGELSGDEVRWTCHCGDDQRTVPWEPDVFHVGLCDEILAEVCEVDVDARTFCEQESGGTCWPAESGDDAWDCTCGETSPNVVGPIVTVRSASCETAAFLHCAAPCEDLTGRCEPAAGTIRFECACDYFAAPRDTPAARCEQALMGCNPELNAAHDVAGLACSGFAGFCDELGNELRCTCADGGEHTRMLASFGEQSAEGCSEALHELCGDGLTEREASICRREKGDRRQCYATFRFAEARYRCVCQSENACNEEYDIRESTVEAASCADALESCSRADDAFERASLPACSEPPSPLSCNGPGRANRTCHAYRAPEGAYACQCFTDDGMTEHDTWDGQADAPTCEAALALCVDADPVP